MSDKIEKYAMDSSILGRLYVVAAPSGAGKTSLVQALLKCFESLKVSISYTTRAARPAEIDGKDYHFIDEQTFQTMIARHDFLEYAKVYGSYYGTSKQWVQQQLAQGVDVILEIDWQGARQVRKLFPATVSIFIVPPNQHVLIERLKKRKQDSCETIMARMDQVIYEIRHCHEFDYLVVNDDFDKVLSEMVNIIKADRLRFERQRIAQATLLAELLKSQ